MGPSDKQLKELIESVDFDNNGKIEFEEFATLMARRMLISDGDYELKQAFKIFDVDDNGRLSVEEIRSMFTHNNNPFNPQSLEPYEVDELVRLSDPDGNGWVTLDEFVNMPCWQLPPLPARQRKLGRRPTQSGAGNSSAADAAAGASPEKS